MTNSDDSHAPAATPEFLAERLLDLGDPETALQVLERALLRDPGSDRARALRSRALLYRRNAHALTPRHSAAGHMTCELAESFVQRGFLQEARVVYEYVLRFCATPLAAQRAELLNRVLAFRVPLDGGDRQERAEELIAAGRLASALAEYRLLSRDRPQDGEVLGRANDLRLLVLGGQTKGRRGGDLAGRTSPGGNPKRAIALVEDGKLEEAMVELQQLASSATDPVYGEAVAALDRLLLTPALEPPAETSGAAATRPVERVGIADMHIRLGNIAAAAELCHAMIEDSPSDDDARRTLADLSVLLRLLQSTDRTPIEASAGKERASPSSPAGHEAPDVRLSKRHSSRELNGYRTSSELKIARAAFNAQDVTAVVRPEEQAELHVKEGSLERAAEIYRHIVARHPTNIRFRERLLYIEQQIADEATPVADIGPGIDPLGETAIVRAEDTTNPEMKGPCVSGPAASTDSQLVFGRPEEMEIERTPIGMPVEFEEQPTGQDILADHRKVSQEAAPTKALSVQSGMNVVLAPSGESPDGSDSPNEPADSVRLTSVLPQITLPITPVRGEPRDGAVTVRRIIVVGTKSSL